MRRVLAALMPIALLFPDSATVAAGITTRRNVTAGTFDVTISR